MKMKVLGVIHILLIVCRSWASEESDADVIVEISSGKIRGRIDSLADGKYSRQFRGIPYAQPPVGNLRFAPPEPVKPWNGVRHATEFASICPQLPMPPPLNETIAGLTISEDCLYLNVFTPRDADLESRLAVMVYIHGGGFSMGGPPDDMAAVVASFYDIIFVGIQYRLGILGLLNIPGTEVRGNFGLRDQIEALKWVQKNIVSFGGDPSRVTIFGESAGAVSVSLLMLMPQAENLFHRVIAQSGAADSVHTLIKVENATAASTFLGYLNCSLGNQHLQCLRSKNQEEILKAQLKVMTSATSGDLFVLISPTVDGDLLTDVPRNLLRDKKFHGIPSIFGVNANEGSVIPTMMFTQMPLAMYTQELFKGFIFSSRNIPEGENDLIKAAILHHYTNYSVSQTPQVVRQQFMDMFGDKFATAPAILNLQTLDEAGIPGYFYVFAHRSKYSVWPEYAGVNHADELLYMLGAAFKTPLTMPLTTGFTEMERGLSSFIMKLWTNFAKYGDPNQREEGHDLVKWPKYTMESQNYLKIGLDCEIGQYYRASDVAFWNDFLPKLAIRKPASDKVKGKEDRKVEL